MSRLLTRSRYLLAVLTLFTLSAVSLIAQEQSATFIQPDQPVQGTLTPEDFAQIYLFVGIADDAVSLTATGETPLALLVTDAKGATLAQSADLTASGTTTIDNLILPLTGSFFVTVLPAPGNPAEGTYTLTLSGASADVPETPIEEPETTAEEPETTAEEPETTAEEPETTVEEPTTPAVTFTEPTQILLANGIEVRLDWLVPVDLNLEVRDPFGNSLFWNSRTSPVGGTFGFDANGLCEIITEEPFETATWAPGFLPTGSYEILVFYRQACDTAQPAPFTVTVTVEGNTLDLIQGVLQPPAGNQNSVYVASFAVGENGQGVVRQGDVYPDSSWRILPAPAQEIIANAQPISLGQTVTGAVFQEQFYQSYQFAAQPNDAVSIVLDGISGSLDTLLQVIDANGNLIDLNDDADFNTTDSALPALRLVQGGDYYIIATRYGKEIGGTEGEYTLTLDNIDTSTLPPEIVALNLPTGDIEVTLIWNTTADMQLLVRDPVGDAIFDDLPQANSGGTLALDGNVNCTLASTPIPASHIYWPRGFLRAGIYEIEVWYQNNCNDVNPVDFTLTVVVDGQLILIENQRPTPDQRFVITFTVNPDRVATAGQGGYINAGIAEFDLASQIPTPITVGQPVIGSITPTNGFDVYSFQGTAGQIVTIAMQASSQTLDTKLFLVSPSGIEIANNDDVDPQLASAVGLRTDSLINAFVLPQDGEYRIVATRFATIYGGTIGGYVLTLD